MDDINDATDRVIAGLEGRPRVLGGAQREDRPGHQKHLG